MPLPSPHLGRLLPIAWICLAVGGAGAILRGEPAPTTATPPVESGETRATAPAKAPLSETAREIQSLFNLGATYVDRKDYTAAEMVYQQILRHPQARQEDQRLGLLDLARMYRQQGADTKAATRAVACYEKYLKIFPDDEATPVIYLELGRTLRTLGTYRLALASFYSVINSTMKLPEEGFEQYRTLAKTAQFEIAETHFQEGEFEEASKFFSRLQLLDLAPADRARAQFKAAYALALAKNYETAVPALRMFVDQNPDDENVPEARYLLSISLRRIGHDQEAFDTVLALLRAEKARQSADPRRWVYWQRRTGNQMANEFYDQGNFWSALVIYESLSALSEQEPAWRLPALYQAGLCYERLRQFDRARASYEAVTGACAALPAKDQTTLGLDDLTRMASWRLLHLGWTEKVDLQVTQLFHTIPSPIHDPSGTAAKPSQVVR
jgi:tetratricopeptide (TPR) repeat protein